MVKSCEVCPYVAPVEEIDLAARITENDDWVANLRYNNQTLLGTSFVTARRHVESLIELTTEEELSFVEIRNRVMTAQMAAFGAEVINVMCLLNNAYQVDEPAPHVHYHLRPRYRTPVIFRGVTYEDPYFGHYQLPTPPVFTELEPTRQIVAAIQANLPR